MANSGIRYSEEYNKEEHSIEVELPFLQVASQDALEKLQFFPITVSPDKNPIEIAIALLKTIEQTRKKAIVIASSDFTHYGINYGYFPFQNDVKEKMYRLDGGALEWIKKINAFKFGDYVEDMQATICGRWPIQTLLEFCRLENVQEAQVLKYYTSGDIVDDYSSAVGYGAVVMK